MAKWIPMEQICCYCESYTFKPGNIEYGQAFCKHFGTWFPKQGTRNAPAGLRTCNHWEQKGVKNETE